MASSVYLQGATYSGVPSILVPTDSTGSTFAKFVEESEIADVNWFGAFNPEFLYEATYSMALSNTTYSSITPSTSTQYAKHPATSYSSSAANYVIFDRYGNGYHNGEALDFSNYNYVILCDTYISTAYTANEATLGKAHQTIVANTGFIWIGQRVRSSSGSLVYPTSSTYGITTAAPYSLAGNIYRTSSNTFTFANTSAYGVGTGVVSPSFQATSSLTSNYINFRTPYFIIRTNSTYMASGAWTYVDADNTYMYNRQRLYRVDKPCVYEQAYYRLGYMIENLAFPTEN